MHTSPFGSRRLLLPVLCLLIVLSATGCGASLVPVSGKVTYKGKAVTTGNIQFLGSDGMTYVAEIGSDGTYSTKVRSGEAKVLISAVDDAKMVEYTKMLSAAGRGGKPGQPNTLMPTPRASGSFSLIPEKYNSWGTSGLTKTIKKGKNLDVDFDLN